MFVCSFTFLGVLCFSPASVLCATWNLFLCLLQTKLICVLCAWRVTTNNCQSQQKVGERNVWPSSVKFSMLKSPDIKINLICLSKCYCSKLSNDCLKMSKLHRQRQEPSSRSKMSLCCQLCNNSCRAVKNFLWHRRDESADIEVIGWSRWLHSRYLGRHNLSEVWPSGSSSPWPFPCWD